MTGISSQEHYVDVSTQKRDDSYVITSVWFSQEGETSNYYVCSFRKVGKLRA